MLGKFHRFKQRVEIDVHFLAKTRLQITNATYDEKQMATKNATLTTRMTRQFDGRITAKEAKGDSSNS